VLLYRAAKRIWTSGLRNYLRKTGAVRLVFLLFNSSGPYLGSLAFASLAAGRPECVEARVSRLSSGLTRYHSGV